MEKSVIEGLETTRHEHKFDFEEATPHTTTFRCLLCRQIILEPEDAGTGA